MKTVAELEARIKELEDAIEWALGEGDSNFGESMPDGVPINKYWWRPELRARAFPPQFEPVETVIWQILDSHGGKKGIYPDFKPTLSADEAAKGWQVIEYRSTYKRPIPTKVKRREEIPSQNGWWKVLEDVSGKPEGAKLFCEWDE